MFRRAMPDTHAFQNVAEGKLFHALQLVLSARSIGQTSAKLRQKNGHFGRVAVYPFSPPILLKDPADLFLLTIPAVTQFVPYGRALTLENIKTRVSGRNNYQRRIPG